MQNCKAISKSDVENFAKPIKKAKLTYWNDIYGTLFHFEKLTITINTGGIIETYHIGICSQCQLANGQWQEYTQKNSHYRSNCLPCLWFLCLLSFKIKLCCRMPLKTNWMFTIVIRSGLYSNLSVEFCFVSFRFIFSIAEVK